MSIQRPGTSSGISLFTLICPAFSQISWLDPVISGNLISALFAALAGALIFNVVLLITQQITGAYVAALCLGFSAAFWSQAIIIEVYALNIFLFCSLILLMYRYARSARIRFLYGFVFVYGLALSNHWPLIVLSTPAFMLMLVPVYKELWSALKVLKTWLVFGALFIAGLLPYITILFKQDPFISLYGAVDGLAELVTYISRSAYGDGTATADWQDKIRYMGWLCFEISAQFGWIADAVILVGIVYAGRYVSRAGNVACWLAFLGSTFFLMLLVNFDYSYKYEAIFRPYPLVSYAVMSVWLAFGFKFITESLSERWLLFKPAALKTGLGLLIVLSVVLHNYRVNYRHEDSLAEDYAELILSLVKPDSNVFLLGDNEIGPVGFLHHVRGMRSDITLYSVRNVVFNNALASPLVSRSEQQEKLRSFVATTESSSYFLSPALDISGVDYGLFIEHRAGAMDRKQSEFVFDEKITRFLDEILTLYEQEQIMDPHSLIFVHNLLLRFSHQYIGYAFEHDSSDPLESDFLGRLKRLQDIFPGRLITLDYVLHNNISRVPKELLLQIVVDVEASIPMETSVRNRAIFYEYAGHVALMESAQNPSDHRLAQIFFKNSLDIYPTADNASLCQLIRVYKQLSKTVEMQKLELEFAGVIESCIKRTAAEPL